MEQYWLNQDPAENRMQLQMSLFGEDPDDVGDVGGRTGQAAGGNHNGTVNGATQGLGDDLETAIHSGTGAPLKRRQPAPEPLGPDLELNDERLLYFRHVGMRDLFAEMVVQSIRDMSYSKDEARMTRLLSKDPEGHEEMLSSAGWLSTQDGQLVIQILYPDWDHVTILKRIHQDTQGILERMTQAGERRAQEIEMGLSDVGLQGGLDLYGRIDWADDEEASHGLSN